jgi:hypothetical protein
VQVYRLIRHIPDLRFYHCSPYNLARIFHVYLSLPVPLPTVFLLASLSSAGSDLQRLAHIYDEGTPGLAYSPIPRLLQQYDDM